MSFLHLLPAFAGTSFAGVNLCPRRQVLVPEKAGSRNPGLNVIPAEAGIQDYLYVL